MKKQKFIHSIDKKHNEFIDEFKNDELHEIPNLIKSREEVKLKLENTTKIDDIMNFKDEIKNINEKIKLIKKKKKNIILIIHNIYLIILKIKKIYLLVILKILMF